jgi:transglutaminase-like putative cysteine protease
MGHQKLLNVRNLEKYVQNQRTDHKTREVKTMTLEQDNLDHYLKPTFTIDSGSEVVKERATLLVEKYRFQREKAKVLFYFVRDEINYSPYPPRLIKGYCASETLQRKEGYCVQKAVVLTALARAVGIPARLGFADIRNNLAPNALVEIMGTNIFVYHGYSELWLNDGWIKATPAFNIEMCNKFDLKPVEFDGVKDAVFHQRNKKGELHIEYIKYHGTYGDLPFEEIMQAFIDNYPVTLKKAK